MFRRYLLYPLNMKNVMFGYGYRRNPKDLEAVGATDVRIDTSRDRPMRSDLFKYSLRKGDTLIVLTTRDLGGSPPADKRWLDQAKEMGVTVIERRPEKKPARIGRPKKYAPTRLQFHAHRAMWLDPLGPPYEAKRKAISADYGSEVTRGTLNGQFGWIGNEKPIPDDMKPDTDKEAD